VIVDDLAALAAPIDKLDLLPGNPRRGDVDAVAKSLAAFGQRKPIVARRDGTVIAGNHTLQAARQLGWPEIAVVWVDDDDTTAKAFALADNRTAELGTYDDQLLADLISEVQSANPDLLTASGWGADGVADLLERLAVEQLPTITGDPDALPERVPSKTVSGDVWLLGPHRVCCGDSTSQGDLDKLMAGDMADMVWTDPPYNVAVEGRAGKIMNDDMAAGEFRSLLDGALASAFVALRPGGAIYVAHSESERLAFTAAFVDVGFKLSGTLVWRKNAMTLSRSDYQWRHEPILYGWRPGAAHQWHGGRKQTSVAEATDLPFVDACDGTWHITVGDRVLVVAGIDVTVTQLESSVQEFDKPLRSELHPTMKPVALVERHIKNSSRIGEVVLDVFGGSGTTLVAAHSARRVARLMELDPHFVDVICARFQQLTGIKPIAEATNNEHDFLEASDGNAARSKV
jgi:DNA modification methylase